MLLAESQWFQPNPVEINRSYKDVYENYKYWLEKGKRQGYYSRTNFSFNNMRDKIEKILSENINIPEQMSLKLPKLKKMTLPKLKKV